MVTLPADIRGNVQGSHIRKRTPLGPYRRPMLRVIGVSWGVGCFLLSEVPHVMFVVRRVARRWRFRPMEFFRSFRFFELPT